MRSALILLFANLSQAQTLEQRLDRLLEAGPGKYFAGVQVYSLESKKVLFKYNDDYLLMPASNMKVLDSRRWRCCGWAPTTVSTTRLVREPSGDVVLIGSGDPSLSGRIYHLYKR